MLNHILIVEDHELTRQGLLFGLKKFPDITVVGEAENGQEALDFLAGKNQVDVVLMDIGLPVMNGIEATQAIKSQFPEIKVIMLTSHQAKEQVFAAFQAGADAYCMKDIKLNRLVQVVEMVREGAVWLDPGVAAYVVQAMPLLQSAEASENSSLEAEQKRKAYNAELTQREREILGLIVEGKSNKEIAEALCISLFTVKNHVCNIIQKLAVTDRTQAAIKALKDQLV